MANYQCAYTGCFISCHCVPHPLKLIVDIFDFLSDLGVYNGGILPFISLSFFQFAPDEVKAFVDQLSDHNKPVPIVGLRF